MGLFKGPLNVVEVRLGAEAHDMDASHPVWMCFGCQWALVIKT